MSSGTAPIAAAAVAEAPTALTNDDSILVNESDIIHDGTPSIALQVGFEPVSASSSSSSSVSDDPTSFVSSGASEAEHFSSSSIETKSNRNNETSSSPNATTSSSTVSSSSSSSSLTHILITPPSTPSSSSSSSKRTLEKEEELVNLLTSKKKTLLREIGSLLNLRTTLIECVTEVERHSCMFDYEYEFQTSPILPALQTIARRYQYECEKESIKRIRQQRFEQRTKRIQQQEDQKTPTRSPDTSSSSSSQQQQQPQLSSQVQPSSHPPSSPVSSSTAPSPSPSLSHPSHPPTTTARPDPRYSSILSSPTPLLTPIHTPGRGTSNMHHVTTMTRPVTAPISSSSSSSKMVPSNTRTSRTGADILAELDEYQRIHGPTTTTTSSSSKDEESFEQPQQYDAYEDVVSQSLITYEESTYLDLEPVNEYFFVEETTPSSPSPSLPNSMMMTSPLTMPTHSKHPPPTQRAAAAVAATNAVNGGRTAAAPAAAAAAPSSDEFGRRAHPVPTKSYVPYTSSTSSSRPWIGSSDHPNNPTMTPSQAAPPSSSFSSPQSITPSSSISPSPSVPPVPAPLGFLARKSAQLRQAEFESLQCFEGLTLDGVTALGLKTEVTSMAKKAHYTNFTPTHAKLEAQVGLRAGNVHHHGSTAHTMTIGGFKSPMRTSSSSTTTTTTTGHSGSRHALQNITNSAQRTTNGHGVGKTPTGKEHTTTTTTTTPHQVHRIVWS